MKYLIKLPFPVKIGRKEQFIYLAGKRCKIIEQLKGQKLIALETKEDLINSLNQLAKVGKVEVLMLDRLNNHQRFTINKDGEILPYQVNGLLLRPTGKCSPDTTISQLSYYLHLCDIA